MLRDRLFAGFRQGGADDRGSVTLELNFVFPLAFLLFLIMVQAALYFHARNLAMAAAQEGVLVERAHNGTETAGAARTREFISHVDSKLLSSVDITPHRTQTQASITVTARTTSIIGIPFSVHQTAVGPVERVTDGTGIGP